MISIFLCDDEPFWMSQLERAITDYKIGSDWEIELACKAASPHELLNYLELHRPQNGLYFLDINFNSEMNGLALATEIRKIDHHATFAFVTTKEEMVMETFRLKLAALDYIIKDISSIKANIHACLNHLETRFLENTSPNRDTLTIRLAGSYKTFLLKDIYYIDTIKNTHLITIHMVNELLSVRSTLANILPELNDNFQKCNKNCLINLQQIKEVHTHNRTIVLNNNEICDCSIREWKQITKLLRERKSSAKSL